MRPRRLVAIVAALAALMVASCGDEEDEESVAERLGSMFAPECEDDGGIYEGVEPAWPRILADLGEHHGAAFKAVIDSRALEANVIGCSAAGGGLMHFTLTSQRAAERATAAYRGGPICRFGRDIFDSSYVNGAASQVARFCEELGGRVIH